MKKNEIISLILYIFMLIFIGGDMMVIIKYILLKKEYGSGHASCYLWEITEVIRKFDELENSMNTCKIIIALFSIGIITCITMLIINHIKYKKLIAK